MTNLFYPVRRTVFFAMIVAGISMGTVAAIAVRNAIHDGKQIAAATRVAAFSIHPGERLSTFWSRLETDGLATREALMRISETVDYPSFPFVPAPVPALNRFEGLFVPGSYRIELPAEVSGSLSHKIYEDDLSIISTLLGRFAQRLERFGVPNEPSSYGNIILASIVQKEDVPGTNYGLVASVFENRLKAGMRLGSCPTLEYALGYHRPFLLDSDIAVQSPYNTYRNHGLPPTPICFFTAQALESVLHPTPSPYRFFVLDWVADKIHFAATYAEQERNARIAKEDYIRVHGAGSLHKKEMGVFY